MNDNFKLSRFVMLAKQHVANTWTYYVKQAMVMGLGMALVACIIIWNMRLGFDTEGVREEYVSMISGIMGLVLLVLLPLSASMLMNNMKTKQERISFMVLPASNLEKFLVRMLHSSIGYLTCFVAGTVIAELIQVVFAFMVTQHCALITPHFYLGIMSDMVSIKDQIAMALNSGAKMPFEASAAKLAVMCYLAFVMIHSSYTLGGALFRKHAWVLTSLCLMAWSMVRFMIMGMLSVNPMELFSVNQDWMFTGYVAYNIVLAGAFYVGAYIIFKRAQGINNSIVNL